MFPEKVINNQKRVLKLLETLVGTSGSGPGATESNQNIMIQLLEDGLYDLIESYIEVNPFDFPISTPPTNIIAYDSEGNQLSLGVVVGGVNASNMTELLAYLNNVSNISLTVNGNRFDVNSNPDGVAKIEFRDGNQMLYYTFDVVTITSKLLKTISENTNKSGLYAHQEITSTTPVVLAANTYKEITFVVEQGSVTVNDGTTDLVYTSSDKTVGFSFEDNLGIQNVITLTLATSSKVKLVTKAV